MRDLQAVMFPYLLIAGTVDELDKKHNFSCHSQNEESSRAVWSIQPRRCWVAARVWNSEARTSRCGLRSMPSTLCKKQPLVNIGLTFADSRR